MMRRISVAPMVDRTTRHFRNFIRLFNKSSTLYTEMITSQAIINGDIDRILKFEDTQHKLVLQIASSDPILARESIKLAEKYPYDEININAGCPSDRVADNKMGAYLMGDKELLKDIVLAIKEVTNKKISIKHRIGIDGKGIFLDNRKLETYDELLEFVDTFSNIGIDKFTVHSRIAILKGLSPHENRTIPPLNYDFVYRLKKDRPNLFIEINGGIKNLDEAKEHLKKVDSVMIGRAVYDNPYMLNEFNLKRKDIALSMIDYIDKMDGRAYHFTMHTTGLYYATKYSKIWKKIVTNPKVSQIEIKEFISMVDY